MIHRQDAMRHTTNNLKGMHETRVVRQNMDQSLPQVGCWRADYDTRARELAENPTEVGKSCSCPSTGLTTHSMIQTKSHIVQDRD